MSVAEIVTWTKSLSLLSRLRRRNPPPVPDLPDDVLLVIADHLAGISTPDARLDLFNMARACHHMRHILLRHLYTTLYIRSGIDCKQLTYFFQGNPGLHTAVNTLLYAPLSRCLPAALIGMNGDFELLVTQLVGLKKFVWRQADTRCPEQVWDVLSTVPHLRQLQMHVGDSKFFPLEESHFYRYTHLTSLNVQFTKIVSPDAWWEFLEQCKGLEELVLDHEHSSTSLDLSQLFTCRWPKLRTFVLGDISNTLINDWHAQARTFFIFHSRLEILRFLPRSTLGQRLPSDALPNLREVEGVPTFLVELPPNENLQRLMIKRVRTELAFDKKTLLKVVQRYGTSFHNLVSLSITIEDFDVLRELIPTACDAFPRLAHLSVAFDGWKLDFNELLAVLALPQNRLSRLSLLMREAHLSNAPSKPFDKALEIFKASPALKSLSIESWAYEPEGIQARGLYELVSERPPTLTVLECGCHVHAPECRQVRAKRCRRVIGRGGMFLPL